MNKVLMASDEKIKELAKDDVLHYLIEATTTWGIIQVGYNFFKHKTLNKTKIFRENCPLKIIDINSNFQNMNFPVNHPIDGMVYINSVINEDVYYPYYDYHSKLREEKMNDFLKLCANLGAKKCTAISDEYNQSSINVNAYAKLDKNNNGKVDFSKNNEQDSYVQISFDFPESNNAINEIDSLWLKAEPTWKSMMDLRKNNGILKCNAEFNYSDDYGINLDFASTIKKIGLGVGCEFKSIKKEKKIFEVEFYPIM